MPGTSTDKTIHRVYAVRGVALPITNHDLTNPCTLWLAAGFAVTAFGMVDHAVYSAGTAGPVSCVRHC